MENNISDAQRQSLLQEIQQLQAEQKEQLRKITLRLEAQIKALRQLKGVPTEPKSTRQDSPPARPTR